MAAKLRTVIFDHEARRSLVDLYGGAELADTACIGIEFVLARDPGSGVRVADGIWMIEMQAKGVWKTTVAYYSFDSDTATVHDIVSV